MEIPPKLDRRDFQTSLALSQMIMGAWVPQAIYTAVSLGVFESLHEGPRSRAEIANRIAVLQETTSRLLRALCCLELCRESESGLFALTRRGRLLCADTAGSMRSLALLRGRQSTWSLWGRLSEVVRTGTCREGSEGLIAKSRLAERCRFVGGDFFQSLPEGGDVYLLMLLLTGGCERTEQQHQSQLRAAGFDVMRILPTSSALHLIEARQRVSATRPALVQ